MPASPKALVPSAISDGPLVSTRPRSQMRPSSRNTILRHISPRAAARRWLESDARPGERRGRHGTSALRSPLGEAWRRPLPPTGKGVQYLLATPRADGSTYVRRRAPKFQPDLESGFPYGSDQWISSMATGWAATALALALEIPGGRQAREPPTTVSRFSRRRLPVREPGGFGSSRSRVSRGSKRRIVNAAP
jgi:hypothetical protein